VGLSSSCPNFNGVGDHKPGEEDAPPGHGVPDRVYADVAARPVVPSERAASRARVDHAVWVPLTLLFSPAPDPTEAYPGETADIEGYFVGPDGSVTIAVTAGTPRGVEMVDSVWSSLRRRGVGIRHLTVLNDRGRIVSMMTLRVGAYEEMLERLRTMLVVPVRSRDGLAEVHLLASDDEVDEVAERIETGKPPPQHPYVVTLPPARETGPLREEDWAFLGLLSSVGAFDGPEGPSPRLVAEALGMDVAAFSDRAAAVQRGLEGVVTDLFGSSTGGPSSGGLVR
jgi:hypothetical protein